MHPQAYILTPEVFLHFAGRALTRRARAQGHVVGVQGVGALRPTFTLGVPEQTRLRVAFDPVSTGDC